MVSDIREWGHVTAAEAGMKIGIVFSTGLGANYQNGQEEGEACLAPTEGGGKLPMMAVDSCVAMIWSGVNRKVMR